MTRNSPSTCSRPSSGRGLPASAKSCGLKPLLEPTSPQAQAVLAETERERLGTLVVDEVECFVRHAPLLHRVPHELLGQLA